MHECAANFRVSEDVNFNLSGVLRVLEQLFEYLVRLKLKNIVPRILLNQINEYVKDSCITKGLVNSRFIQFNYLEQELYRSKPLNTERYLCLLIVYRRDKSS